MHLDPTHGSWALLASGRINSVRHKSERFYRAEASRTTPGSGLGLSLVAEILKLHGFAAVLETDNPGCRIEPRCWPQKETEVTPAPEIMVTSR